MEHLTGEPVPHDDGPADLIGTDAAASTGRRRIGAVAVGVVVLVGAGGAAAWAAGSTPSPSTTPGPGTTTPSPRGYGEGGGGPRGGGPGHGGLGLAGGALHGRLTVPGTGSTYEDVLVQRGEVTAVSPTSLAVRSADGYAHTYRLVATTVVDGRTGDSSSLAVGDTVGVLAGTDDAARVVHERRAGLRAGPDGEAPGHLPGQGHVRPPHDRAPAPATPAPDTPSAAPSGSSQGSAGQAPAGTSGRTA